MEWIKSTSVSLCRYALNEMDKFSLKDSGRGDSEAGDSDYDLGRESPMDRLLGEGFTEIYAPDGQHRTHAGTPLAPYPLPLTSFSLHPVISLPLNKLHKFIQFRLRQSSKVKNIWFSVRQAIM